MPTTKDFLKAFFDDEINFRVFSDRKAEDDKFKGQNYTVKQNKIDWVLQELANHNQKNRGIFFVINSGGHEDKDINKINAQFFECDDISIDKQLERLKTFPLSPSIVVKTRKSLHVYFLMKDAKVESFRRIQKKLIKCFGGDPTSVNESRVYRVPGFDHCKKEPIKVEIVEFHPELRYTQVELEKHLPEIIDAPAAITDDCALTMGQKGLEVVCEKCEFIRHCKNNASSLSEFDWYAMISNMAIFENGIDRIHEYSSLYSKYSREETDNKIKHFMESKAGPILCKNIFQKGFKCSNEGKCKTRSPAGLAYQKLNSLALTKILDTIPTCGEHLQDLEAAQKFIDDFFINVDLTVAESFIQEKVKAHFGLNLKESKNLTKKFLAQAKEKSGKEPSSDGMDYFLPLYEVIAIYRRMYERVTLSRIADIAIKWFIENGAKFYIQLPDKCLMFFENMLYSIGDNIGFTSILFKHGKFIATTGEGRAVIQAIKNTAYIIGQRGFAGTWLHIRKDMNSIYINLHNDNNEILKIAPKSVEVISNGVNEDMIVLGTTSTNMEQIKYRKDVHVPEGITLFKTLILDNLSCSDSNKIMIGSWIIAMFLKAFTETRPILKFSGTSKSGKSTAAKLITCLIYGHTKCNVSTTAAMFESGARDPILVLDNLENENISKDAELFLLTSSTGVSKKKMGANNTDVVEKTVDCMVILTAIEPLDKSELINRTYDIKFDKEYKKHGFIEDLILTEIQKNRDLILSSIFKMFAQDILPNITEFRINAIKFMSATDHSKDRTNEFLSLMYISTHVLREHCSDIMYGKPVLDQIGAWLDYNDDTTEKTESDTNQNLYFLELLLQDLRREQENASIPRYSVSIIKDRQGDIVGFECIVKELYTCFAMMCKERGLRFKYKSPKQLGERLKNDKETLAVHGWTIEKTKMYQGFQKYSYVKGVCKNDA